MPRLLCLLTVLLGCCLTGTAAAETPSDRDPTWVTDGSVNALARDGQTLYLGGQFSRLSAPTGTGVILDAAGSRLPGPAFDGDVYASAADGAGGLYVGGSFRHVDGAAASVVHLRPDGSLDPAFAAPVFSMSIGALAVSAGHVYVGGQLGTVDGAAGYDNLVRLSRTSGAVDPTFRPVFTGYSDHIASLAILGNRLFVGGSFTAACKALGIGCVPRDFAAEFSTTTGNISSWAPNLSLDVTALLPGTGAMYIGGRFSCVGTQGDQNCVGELARPGLAKVDLVNGAPVAAFNARLGDPGVGSPLVRDLRAAPGGKLIAVGQFSCTGYDEDLNCTEAAERVRHGIARLSDTSGAADTFATGADSEVQTAALVGGTLWVGGNFDALGGQPRAGLGAVDLGSGAVLPADPSPNGAVRELELLGSGVFVGGSFTGLGGVARTNLAALDLQTGVPTAWAPAPNGVVSALHSAAGRLYAGGAFTQVDGAPRGHAAAFDLPTGATLPWNPAINGMVATIAATADAVYIGGSFSGLGGDAGQGNLGAVGAADGLARPFPEASSAVEALALRDGLLYVGGHFAGSQALGDQARQHAGAIELAGATVTPWAPQPDAAVKSLAPSADGVVLGGEFSFVGDQQASGIVRVDVAQGALDAAWGPDDASSVNAVRRDGDRVVAAGSFFIGGVSRGLVTLDAATGAPTAWDPAVRGSVFALEATAGAVYAGGSFQGVGSRPAGGFAGYTPLPAARRAPAIAGDATRTCDPGDWEGAPLLAVAWRRDGAQVGAGTSYVVGDADRGHALVCRVTATSIRGSASADSAPVSVAARDTVAPLLSRLSLSAKRPKAKGKLALRLTVSEDATVSVAVERAVKGRRHGKRCKAGRRTGRRCTAYKRVKLLRVTVKAGTRRIVLPRRKLAPAGRYRLVVRAVDAAGNHARKRTLPFRLRKR